MLTVRNALKMPVFERATLVAGANGQDKVIRRAHIIDLPGATFEWVRGGELLLTSGGFFHDDEERKRGLIPKLASRGMAGMVLSVGWYFSATPPPLREAGNRLDFPIIELPPDIAFIDVTEAVYSQIVGEHYAIHERAQEIQRTLHNLVLEGGTLQLLAEVLSGILKRSVVIENVAFEVLATAQVGTVDMARMRSLSAGRTPPDLAYRLIERGIYKELLEVRRPVRVPAIPDLDMTMQRIVAPIIVAQQIMGFVWLIAGERELTNLDELALEHAATVAALIMFKERAVRQAEITLRGDFLEQIFNVSDAQDPTLVEQAQQLDFNLGLEYQVMVAERTGTAPDHLSPPLLPQVEDRLRALHPALVVPREMRVVILLQGRHPPDGHRIAQELVDSLRAAEMQVLIGIGRAVTNLAGLRVSYNQAVEALKIAQALGQRAGLRNFDELGVLHWLRHLSPKLLGANIYLDAIRRLAEYDEQHHQNLLLTLETYLDVGGVAEVATRLHVHRNTLSYRLERIEQLLDLDLRDPACRMNLYVALKAYRLHNGPAGAI